MSTTAGATGPDAGIWACEDALRISTPLDGASDQAPSVSVGFSFVTFCEGPPGKIALFDSAGTEVPADLLLGPPVALKPRSALSPGTYEVRTSAVAASKCPSGTDRPVTSTFTVGPAPAVREIQFSGGSEDQLSTIRIFFSEAVAASAKDRIKEFVTVSGPEPSEAYLRETMDELYWGYKGLAEASMPLSNNPVTIHVGKDLAFESGAKLAQDFDLTVTPDEWEPVSFGPTVWAWKPGRSPCTTATTPDAGTRPVPPGDGCSSVPGGASLPVLALLLGVFLWRSWSRRETSAR